MPVLGVRALFAVLLLIGSSHVLGQSPKRSWVPNVTVSIPSTVQLPSISPSIVLDRVAWYAKPKPVHSFHARLTPYYTPVPGQRKYYNGSYEEDLRINGTGTTFSGKYARVGHIAADLSYHPLGTVMRIPGYDIAGEVGVVEDKGSAIRGPYRLDLYMGRGEEGLQRVYEWERKNQYRVTVEILKTAK